MSYGGEPFAVDEHLERLGKSAAALQIAMPAREDLEEWVRQIAAETGDGAVRIVLTRGASIPGLEDGPRTIVFGHDWPPLTEPGTLLPVVAPWHAAGVDWDLAGAKVTSYAPNLAASRRAKASGFDDALLTTVDEVVLEGPTFSVAWVVDGVVETPSLDLGILDSITRRVALEDARGDGIVVVEGRWSLDRLASASEVFAMSTIREVQPIRRVGELEWSAGAVSARLRELFQEHLG